MSCILIPLACETWFELGRDALIIQDLSQDSSALKGRTIGYKYLLYAQQVINLDMGTTKKLVMQTQGYYTCFMQ